MTHRTTIAVIACAIGMQGVPGLGTGCAIKIIVHKGMAHISHMYANLVGATGEETQAQ